MLLRVSLISLRITLWSKSKGERRYTTTVLPAYRGNIRCVVLPHIASATTETRTGMATLAIENMMAVLTGKQMPREVIL
jgi:lactate dehydrogenase-like 2-hydroxyacid dehydrogenase